jgi:hypothetical protein
MIDYTVLPTVNATLNAIAGIFLLVGYVLIRRGQIDAHRNAMLGAFAASTLFLISYVIYHANAGSRPFTGEGAIRYVYFAILISHVLPQRRFCRWRSRHSRAGCAAATPSTSASPDGRFRRGCTCR